MEDMIRVRYWAGACDVAGVTEELIPAGTFADVCAELTARHGPRMQKLLAVSVVLSDGEALGAGSRTLGDPSVLEVLPPFAGG